MTFQLLHVPVLICLTTTFLYSCSKCHGFTTVTSLPSIQQSRSSRAFSSVTLFSTSSSTTSTSTNENNNKNNKDAWFVPKKKSTPVPKYPVQRGSEVDSRAIVGAGSMKQSLTAVYLKHILFQTEALCASSMYELRGATMSFDTLAMQLSDCTETRNDGGKIGWVSVMGSSSILETKKENQTQAQTLTNHIDSDSDNANADADDVYNEKDALNEHLDLLLPPKARKQVLMMNTKPGDVVMVESERGYHLVQIADVMVDVTKMAMSRKRKPNAFGNYENQKQKTHEKNDTTMTMPQQQQQQVTKPKTYRMETMGCQMNAADSERMEGQLQSLGYQPLSDSDMVSSSSKNTPAVVPSIIVLNTCSIRDHAEQKVYSYLGPYAKRKRNGEDITIVIAGCVAQQQAELLLRQCPEVDLVMGPQYANRMADLLEDVMMGGNQVVATDAAHIMEDSTKPRRASTVAAWVNVIYGCNERCSFCIVPTTRGVEQSRPVESIVQEVQDLVQDGYKEVTLLGQNIDAYGRDMVPKRKFSDLLRTIGSISGLDRLRFVTSHPRYMSMGVIDAVADLQPVAAQCFHIPFQSGSNTILQKMGRGHSREKYLLIVERIRKRLPDAAITADVIVGFPGETEGDFEDTLSLMEEVVFDSVNTAAYSPRPNTPAAEYTNQIPEGVKQNRLQRINVLNKKHAAMRRARMLGRVVDVLVEERNIKVPTQIMGRTTQGYIVYCDGDIDELQGHMISVKIETTQTYYLAGTRVI